MAVDFDFFSPADKPALLAISSPQLHTSAKFALQELDYKVQSAATHDEFMTRFTSVPYQVVIIEETFASITAAENISLSTIQALPMGQRRHATFIILGETVQTLHAMQAFQRSVHAVVHAADASKLKPILQQVVADSALLTGVYRDIQNRVAQGKI